MDFIIRLSNLFLEYNLYETAQLGELSYYRKRKI